MAKITTIPWSNVNCEKDIVDALVWSKWILRILGIWPLVFPVTSRVEKILATTSFALSWSALGFLLIPIAIFTLSDHTVTNDKVKMLGPLGHVLISMLKYLFLVVRHKSIRQCIRGLSFDWRAVQRENYRTIMMKDSMKSHMLSKFCIAFMYCGGLSYVTVMPFLSQKPDGEKNATVGPVPYLGFDIIFDLRFVPGYVFVFCMQCFSAVVMFNITTAVYCLAAMFVAHACGQIEIVMARVESFMKDVQSNRINSEHCMAVIVKHHVKALSICSGHARLFTVSAADNLQQSLSHLRNSSMTKIIAIPWSNVNYEKDIVDALMWSRRILRVLGIWPLIFPDTSTIEKILATISFSVCWSALGFLLIPMTIYTLSDQTLTSDKIKMLGPLGYVVASVLKYMLLVIRHRSIRRCIHVLSIDWRAVQQEDYRMIMIKDSAKGHVLSKFCIAFIYCGGLCYNTVIPFLSPRPDNELNTTVGPVTYPGFDIIFDLRFVPAYVFVFCAQLLSSVIMFNITTSVCCLAATFVAHACGQIGIVMAKVKGFVKNVQSNRTNSKHRMAIIVNHHVQALREKVYKASASACLMTLLQSMLCFRFAQSSAKSVLANMKNSREGYVTSPNVNYQQDMQYVFKPSSWILGSMGIWPITIQGIRKHVSTIAIVVYNFALVFAMVPCILHIIYDQKDLNLRLKLCGLLGFCLTALTKYFILVIRRSKIQSCIEQVKKDWWQVKFKSDRECMLKYASIGRKLSLICVTAMYSAGFIYHLILPFCTEHKIGNQTIRPLVYPTYSEFRQSQISPTYEIVYVAHCVCGYTIYSITVGTCGLAAIFSTHACGQIQMIISRLEDLLNGKNFEQVPNVQQRIAAIVKGNVQIIRFAAVVEEVLQEVCLVEFTSSLCTICLLEYYCILVR
ncbi:hypothetical protein EAI_02320 [Harpegnathos saltator]|uniref:Odorant receptor 13a n=1 Tax=Harpegnathos saltator TaxID=610380 RepID=E2BZK9_HARSA|nr:hypothetical protein EAI_02320 [Harpegnathos saltator]